MSDIKACHNISSKSTEGKQKTGRAICEYKAYDLIKHENIETGHLSPYGIHLNRQGSSVMASYAVEGSQDNL